MNHIHPKYEPTSEFIFDDTDPFADMPKRLDVKAFLKDEFFNSSPVTYSRILNFYRKLYGTPACNYMKKTFPSWKSGKVELSELIMSRLLTILPRVLTPEKRFYMMKVEVCYYLNTMQYFHQHKTTSQTISAINSLFINYYHKIIKFDINRLSWFISKGIFSEADVEDFLAVSFCAIREQLALNCRQVFNDLRMIRTKLEQYNIASINASYYIKFLDIAIDISQIKTAELTAKQFDNIEPNFSGPFKEYHEQYFLSEIIKLDRCKKEGERNAYIKAHDLEMLLSLYEKNVRENTETKIASSVNGEGGILYINLSHVPVTSIIGTISVPSLKILGLLSFQCFFLYLFFEIKTLGYNILGFYGSLLVVTLLCLELFRLTNTIIRYLKHG